MECLEKFQLELTFPHSVKNRYKVLMSLNIRFSAEFRAVNMKIIIGVGPSTRKQRININICFSHAFIVPIIPEFLYDIRHPNATLDSLPRIPLTTPIPCDRPNDETEFTTLSAGK